MFTSSSRPLLNSDVTTEDSEEQQRMRKQLIRGMTYGDVGKIALGPLGLFVVNFCLIFTQFGFCINYFIFVGNTIQAIFPETNITVPAAATSVMPAPSTMAPAVEIHLQNTSFPHTDIFSSVNDSTTAAPFIENSTTIPIIPLYEEVINAPDLRLLVLTPLPIFAGFAILRDVRHLGFVSVGADVSIFVGSVVTMLYMCAGKYVREN